MIDAIRQDNLVARAAELGARLLNGFRRQLEGVAGVTDIRGKGLMLGIALDRPCGELVTRALAEGLLINVTSERVIRLLPPLILSDQQADQIIHTVATLVQQFLTETAGPAGGATAP